jgi:hypothetical protein
MTATGQAFYLAVPHTITPLGLKVLAEADDER